jgi:hypothetical protein
MAQPGIPGLDVTEFPTIERGARNPNVGAAGSADAQAWRGARMGPNPAPPGPISGPAPGSAPDLAQRGMRAVRQAGAAVADSIPGSVKTAGRVLGKVAAPALALSAAADSTAPDSTARYAKRFGMDEPTGNGSFGDVAKFAGLRTLGYASDLGNALTFGQAGKLFADNQPGAMPAQPQQGARSPAVAPLDPNPQDLHLAGGTRATPLDLAHGPADDGAITVDGNSYSGANVGATPTFRNPDGSLRSSNGTLSVMPTLGVDGYSRMLNNIRSLGPALDTNYGGPAGIGNSRASNKPSQWYEALGLSRTDLLGLRPRDIRHLQSLAAEQRNASLRADTDTSIAGMRERGDMARANLGAQTQRAINERQVELGLRGQDITREGHMINAQGQRARLNYDVTKDQRDYATGRADKDFDQRQTREKQLQSNIEAMTMGTDNDGKPVVNPRAAAEVRQGIDRAVARLGANGVHDLGPRAEQQLMAASTLMKTMRENAGWLPWQPDKLKSIDPLDLTALKVMPNGDRMITRKDSKAMGQTIPARFFQTEEGVRFFGGTPTNRYDILSESN